MRHIPISILAAIAIAIGGFACTKEENRPDPERIFLSEIRSVNKLVLAGMEISKMASIDDPRLSDAKNPRQAANAILASLKIGNRKAAYSYSTYLCAYIDLSLLNENDISVDEANRTISITLPPVRTEFVGRDMHITEEHYRVTGMRSQINPEERAMLKEKMNQALKKEVESNSDFRNALVATARNRATAYFEQMASANGYSATVNFKQS